MNNTTYFLRTSIVLLAIFLSTPVFAQDLTATSETSATRATDADVKVDAGLTKGDTFYFVDRTAEEVKMLFITDPVAKAEFSTQLYRERLAETRVLIEEGKMDAAQRTLELYIQEFASATSIALDYNNALTAEEKASYQMRLGEDATRNLAELQEMKQSATEIDYFIGLIEAKTIDQQRQLIVAIATYDQTTADRVFEEALELQVRNIQDKSEDLENGSIAELDSIIQNFNQYADLSTTLDQQSIDGTRMRTSIDSSVESISNVLSGVKTTTYIRTVADDGTVTSNPTSDATNRIDADTGAPREILNGSAVTSVKGGGAPAYRSNDNGGLSWKEYIDSRRK